MRNFGMARGILEGTAKLSITAPLSLSFGFVVAALLHTHVYVLRCRILLIFFFFLEAKHVILTGGLVTFTTKGCLR